jgi:hypothetical protein
MLLKPLHAIHHSITAISGFVEEVGQMLVDEFLVECPDEVWGRDEHARSSAGSIFDKLLTLLGATGESCVETLSAFWHYAI